METTKPEKSWQQMQQIEDQNLFSFGDEVQSLVMSIRIMTLSERLKDGNMEKSTEELGTEILQRMIAKAKEDTNDKAVSDFENAILRLSHID